MRSSPRLLQRLSVGMLRLDRSLASPIESTRSCSMVNDGSGNAAMATLSSCFLGTASAAQTRGISLICLSITLEQRQQIHELMSINEGSQILVVQDCFAPSSHPHCAAQLR